MEKPDFQEWSDELQRTEDISKKFRRKNLIVLTIRWIFTIILYVVLWNKYTWIKWTLILLIPLGLYNLYQIFNISNTVDSKMADLRETLSQIGEAEEEE